MEPDLAMDLSSSEAMSPMHLGSVTPSPDNIESKDEEPEAEQPLSPGTERRPLHYIDEGISPEDDKFSNIRVCNTCFTTPSSEQYLHRRR